MTPPPSRPPDELFDRRHMQQFVDEVFDDVDLHAKRVESLANAAVGTLRAATLPIHAIGEAYAELAGIQPKHGIKQVDRFLSNPGIDVETLRPAWIRFVLGQGERKEIVVALDWTD